MLIYCLVLLYMGDVMAQPKDLEESKEMMLQKLMELQNMEVEPDPFVEPVQEKTSGVPMRQMVRGPKEFTPEGVPTFQFDMEDPLHNILQKSALDATDLLGKDAFIDVTGGDRSAQAIEKGLSEDRHSFGNAVDIGVKSNPSYFNRDGSLKPAGKVLVRNLLESGDYRLFAGPKGSEHLHIDRFVDKDMAPDDFDRLYQEGGKEDTPMMKDIRKIHDEIFSDRVLPETESLADKLRKKIQETQIPEAVAPPEVDPFS